MLYKNISKVSGPTTLFSPGPPEMTFHHLQRQWCSTARCGRCFFSYKALGLCPLLPLAQPGHVLRGSCTDCWGQGHDSGHGPEERSYVILHVILLLSVHPRDPNPTLKTAQGQDSVSCHRISALFSASLPLHGLLLTLWDTPVSFMLSVLTTHSSAWMTFPNGCREVLGSSHPSSLVPQEFVFEIRWCPSGVFCTSQMPEICC